MLRRWSTYVFPHRKKVLAVWLVLMVALGALSSFGSKGLDPTVVVAPRSESAAVMRRLRPLNQAGTYLVGITEARTSDRSAVKEVHAVATKLRSRTDVKSVISYAETPVATLKADDGSSFATIVVLDGTRTTSQTDRSANQVAAALSDTGSVRTVVTGDAMTSSTSAAYAKSDGERAEIIAIPIALVVLFLILGGFMVSVLPLLTAGTAILATTASFLIWEQFLNLNVFASNITTLFGIGLGIDYGLLMVSRFREERGTGHDPEQALARTVHSAGRTVIFSAGTVAVSLAGLLFFRDPMLTSFAIAGTTVTLLVAFSAVFVLPALIAVLSKRIKPLAPAPSGAFIRIATMVQRRPVVIMVVVSLGLLALATPFLHINPSLSDEKLLPLSSPVRQGADLLQAHYPSLVAQPVVVLADDDGTSKQVTAYMKQVSHWPGVLSVALAPNITGAPATPAVIHVITTGAATGVTAKTTVQKLRAFRSPLHTQVGGLAAQTIDDKAAISTGLPWGLGWLVGSTLVLLFLMTGSVLIPIKAVIMNVLALGASFGALVWVFQQGHGASLLGFSSPGYIEMTVPIEVAMFAFGLSMDYEVFLLSRIKEAYDLHRDNNRAVREGAGHAGRIITTAALLIVTVFGAALAGELVSLKMFAFAIGLAVIIDATVIRTLLVPATMTVLGDWNWWAPRPLRRFHDRFGISDSTVHDAPTTWEPTVFKL